MNPLLFQNINGPILIVAPHPDDDVLGSGGLIQKAVRAGKPVYVIYLTNGDANRDTLRHFLHVPLRPDSYRKLGFIRHQEALRVEHYLGVPQSHLFFLSFPDSISLQIATSPNPNQVYRSPATLLDKSSYPFSYRRNAPYSKAAALSMFVELLRKIKPETVIVNHPADRNPDHRAARIFLLEALRLTNLSPVILSFLVHYPKWPTAQAVLTSPSALASRNVRSLALTGEERMRTYRAFQLYRSQFNPRGRLPLLIKNNELFWLG